MKLMPGDILITKNSGLIISPGSVSSMVMFLAVSDDCQTAVFLSAAGKLVPVSIDADGNLSACARSALRMLVAS